MTDSGGADGGWRSGPDGAETMGAARAREAERHAAQQRPRLGTWAFACSVRAVLLAVVAVVALAWLLTALNAG